MSRGGGIAAFLEERAGLCRAAFRFPEGGCQGGGGGGGAGFILGRAAAPPLRQPAGGLEPAAPPGLHLRGAAPALAAVPGRAASSRFPLRRSWTAAGCQRGQQAAASWSAFFRECPFISPCPFLSLTCSLSFSLHSTLLVISLSPTPPSFTIFWGGLCVCVCVFPVLLFLFPPSCSFVDPLHLVPLNFFISSDFFPWTLPCHVKMEVRHDWLSSSPHEGFEQMRLKSRPREPSPSLTRVGANFYSTVKQQDYSASVWLRRKDKLEHVSQFLFHPLFLFVDLCLVLY